MIVSKTPLRIPLAGGLTDLKEYAEQFGGVTVSATIDKYIYVVLKESLDGYIDLKYQNVHEKVDHADRVRHDLTREALRLVGLEEAPLELSITADLSSESGLGSSGAVTVGILNALHAYKGEIVSQRQLLEEAGRIEVDILEGASGYHDPSICALGGLKLIEYTGSKVEAREIQMSQETRWSFEDSLLFFYSGRHAKTKPSLDLLSNQLDVAFDALHEIKALGYDLENAFCSGDLQRVGEIVSEQQQLKMALPGNFVDQYVLRITERIARLGGYAQLPGGKISAFVIVFCPHEKRRAIREALSDLQEVRFRLSTGGAEVIRI